MCVVNTGSAYAGLTYGLSRMMGNYHVRFLGEGAAEMPLPYPTEEELDSCRAAGERGQAAG
jgi:hypothetical protein